MSGKSNYASSGVPNRTLADRMELLVEGELDAAATTQLLAELDQRPELWKSLALDFVQHRSIARSVKDICEQPVSELPGAEHIQSDAHRRSQTTSIQHASSKRLNSLLALTAIAACLLIGFVGGFSLSNLGSQSGFDGRVANLAHRADNDTPRTDSLNGNPVEVDSTEPTSSQAAPEETLRVVGRVNWVGRFGPQLSPVFRGDTIDAQWLTSNPPQVSPATQKAFANAGVKLVSERRLINLSLDTGEKFTIPLDEFMLRREQKQVF